MQKINDCKLERTCIRTQVCASLHQDTHYVRQWCKRYNNANKKSMKLHIVLYKEKDAKFIFCCKEGFKLKLILNKPYLFIISLDNIFDITSTTISTFIKLISLKQKIIFWNKNCRYFIKDILWINRFGGINFAIKWNFDVTILQ